MRVKPSEPRLWLTSKILCSASSSSSVAGARRLERFGDDRRRDFDQSAAKRLLANDLGVVLDVRRCRHGVDEKSDVVLAAARLEGARPRELLGERERIDYIASLGEGDHRAKNPPMALAVEHRVVEEFRRAQNGVGIHEHCRQNRLLRVFGVGRPAILVWVTRVGRYREFYGRA